MPWTRPTYNLVQLALNAAHEEAVAAQHRYSVAHAALQHASEELTDALEVEVEVLRHALDLGVTRAELVEAFGEYVENQFASEPSLAE